MLYNTVHSSNNSPNVVKYFQE